MATSGWNFNIGTDVMPVTGLAGYNQAVPTTASMNNLINSNLFGSGNPIGNPFTGKQGNSGISTQATNGWNTFSNVLGGIGAITNAFTGFKQFGLAKDQFNWQKDAFNTNLLNQANLINRELERKATADAYWSNSAPNPSTVMSQYGVASSIQEANERQQQNQNAWNQSKALNNVATGG